MTARFSASRETVAQAVAGFVAIAAGLYALSPAPVGVFWDDAVYVITAKALATGEGYRYIHLPGTPPATHYPPLWPMLLSIVWRVAPEFPDNARIMKLLNPVLLGVAAVALTALAVRVSRRFDARLWVGALAAAASIAVAPMLLLSAVLMSEPLCLALSAGGLMFATRAVMGGRARDGVIAGVLVGLAVLARSAAIVLIPALLAGVLWRRGRRASLVAFAVSLVVALPWFAWSSAHAAELPAVLAGSYGPYAPWIGDAYLRDPQLLFAVVAQNVRSIVHDAGVVVYGGLPRAMRTWFVIPLFALCTAGLLLAGRRASVLTLTLAGYAALVIVWPYPPGRFMWAFFPLYAVGALVAFTTLARRARRMRFGRAVSFAVVAYGALTLAMVVRYDVLGLARGWHRIAIETNADGMVDAVGWIARYTAPSDTIATDVHLLAYLYAGRLAVPLNSLTVAEHVHAKTGDAMRREFAAIDSTFRPRWWISTGMVPERAALLAWAQEPGSIVRPITQLAGGGLVTRVIGR